VKAPLAWPKSSLSSSVSGTAAQLISMNRSVRALVTSWMARATISLPEPDSPPIRIDVSLPLRLCPTFSSTRATFSSPGQPLIMRR
jgi:hypothetical protein